MPPTIFKILAPTGQYLLQCHSRESGNPHAPPANHPGIDGNLDILPEVSNLRERLLLAIHATISIEQSLARKAVQMSMEDPMQQLHDKATRGIALSASEQARLDAWYASQDQAEGEELASPQSMHTISALQAQVDRHLASSHQSQARYRRLPHRMLHYEKRPMHCSGNWLRQ